MTTRSNSFRRIRALTRTMRKTNWHFIDTGRLRTNENLYPLMFVTGYKSSYMYISMVELGFTNSECCSIIGAADNNSRGSQMCRILIRAANLEEVPIIK